MTTYTPKTYDLSDLTGISDQTLEVHFGLYAGYVKNTNILNEQLAEITKAGVSAEKMPLYSEIKRRLGFEYNGMVLHEYYFGNMKKGGGGDAASGSAFHKAAAASFGSYEAWKTDFANTGKMRGVGWAICFRDPSTGALSNHWISDHEYGNVAGYAPVLVMDVWEHAFLLDYKPADRPKYIEAFMANVDWSVVNGRLG
jgi:superoxide dismutase, Fe-Mn family